MYPNYLDQGPFVSPPDGANCNSRPASASFRSTQAARGLGARSGTDLASPRAVLHVLEVQFHPKKKGKGAPIPVAQILFRGDRMEIRPLATADGLGLDQGDVLLKLHFLAEMTSPQSFERLRELRSDFWSFVEVEAANAERTGSG